MQRLLTLTTALGAAALLAPPAAAQDTGGERVMMVQLQEGEVCPQSEDPDTIVVCEQIEDPYRIPSRLRQSNSPENRSWAQRARENERVGAFGPGSCTNVGGGSEIGCSIQEIELARAERENSPERRFSLQIEQARAERLETIDADARMTQARVEELERAYLERLEAERDAPLPGEEEALPELRVVDPDAIPQRPPVMQP
ncbi:hypothetical protein [Alteraurantiacibacter palmitatis]|uniref:DUF4124 domain-containing protein n=1 Tax=Alteraurantiacibacter palmitatis TaxID=2054628 RepID=A0ABV7E2D4_9SPHN